MAGNLEAWALGTARGGLQPIWPPGQSTSFRLLRHVSIEKPFCGVDMGDVTLFFLLTPEKGSASYRDTLVGAEQSQPPGHRTKSRWASEGELVLLSPEQVGYPTAAVLGSS